MPSTDFVVRPIRGDDKTDKLSLGHKDYQPLKTFLKRDACAFEDCSVARTFVLVEKADAKQGGRIWGYLSLAASEVITTSQNRPQSATWPDAFHVPSIKLARMAVDKELQGQDWGTQLLEFALALINGHVRVHVGCRLLITDAKQKAVGFYEKCGFTMLDTPENKKRDNPVMFIMLNKLTKV